MKLFLSILILFVFHFSLFAQDTIYFTDKLKVTKVKDSATTFQVDIHDVKNKEIVCSKTFTIDNLLTAENNFSNYSKGVRQGASRSWVDGKLMDSCWYENGKRDGTRIKYWSNSKVRRKEIYVVGEMKQGNCFDSTGLELDYFPEQTDPEYPGGTNALYQFIANNFKYPDEALYLDQQGKIYVSFVINKDGKVEQIKILRGVSYSLDNEAMRVVKLMPNWTPGTQEGKIVKVRYTLPIVAKIEEDKKKKRKKNKR